MYLQIIVNTGWFQVLGYIKTILLWNITFMINVFSTFCVIFSVREQLKDLTKQYDKSENDLKALQSVGQIVGEVLKQLTEEKCKL